ncbi:hypothetical protein ACE34P_004094 [Vibrio fluvialis]
MFEMSKALHERAMEIRSNLGDHGDPYEESLLKGEVTVGLKIMVKEIFDHLRSSLDYCARETVSTYLPDLDGKIIYFPIVSHKFKEENFKGRIGQLLPEITTKKPELIPVFASFQAFSSPDNIWLSKFATLCNKSKHEQLSIINCLGAKARYSKNEKGETIVEYSDQSDITFKRMPLMLITGYPDGGEGECYHHYILFDEIRVELLTFLDDCISGVRYIISELESAQI